MSDHQWFDDILVFGSPVDQGALTQIRECANTAARAVMTADHHLGYSAPIGGVLAYENQVSPSGAGYDIGCGNTAVLTDMPGSELRANISPIMDDIWDTISFGIGRKNQEKVDHEVLDRTHRGWDIPFVRGLRQLAADQLGTVGSGNHYVDLFTDEQDRVWVGVHFGSRGFGHKIASHYMKQAGAVDGIHAPPTLIGLATSLGQEYLAAMELAGEYAHAGRDWVCHRVVDLLGARALDLVNNHHNFAWLEEHDGKEYYVVRKGATPAFPGQRSFVGGSMGEPSVIIEGQDTPLAKDSLYSTVHGAGRVMGRMEARGKIRKGKVIREPKVTRAMMDDWIRKAGVELRGADVDESPHCYKRLADVLTAHGDSIRVLHTLTPVGVAMAAAREFDPYKD